MAGVTERLSSRSSQLRSSILYVAIIGIQWALAAVTFGLIFAPSETDETGESSDGMANGFEAAPFIYRVLFAVVLGLLGVTDMASWLATSLPAFHEMRLQRRLGQLISDDAGTGAAEAEPGVSRRVRIRTAF